MVGVIMARHDVADVFLGPVADVLQQRPAKRRRAERVEHDDTVRCDDIAGVGRVAFIGLAGNAGVADSVENILAGYLLHSDGPVKWRIIRRFDLSDKGGRHRRPGQSRQRRYAQQILHIASSQYRLLRTLTSMVKRSSAIL